MKLTKEKLIQRIEEGHKASEISDEFDRKISMVFSMASRYGYYDQLMEREYPKLTVERVSSLYWEEEMNGDEIAEVVGCSGPFVYKFMYNHGIPTRDPIAQEGENNLNWGGLSDNVKSKISKKLTEYWEKNDHPCKNNPEFQEKMRDIMEKKIEEGEWYPGYSEFACDLLDEMSEVFGWDIQHALNGGEYHIEHLDYWVDGYIEDEKIVIEMDEEDHYLADRSLRKRDRNRHDRIKQWEGCERLIRIPYEYWNPEFRKFNENSHCIGDHEVEVKHQGGILRCVHCNQPIREVEQNPGILIQNDIR